MLMPICNWPILAVRSARAALSVAPAEARKDWASFFRVVRKSSTTVRGFRPHPVGADILDGEV